MDFCCDLPNGSSQKQVKANEVYLPWIFGKKKIKLMVINTERKPKTKFLMLLKKRKK